MKALLLLPLLVALGACNTTGPHGVSSPAPRALPWKIESGTWRVDRAWYDGTAEKCVYQATRTIYGKRREYLATAYTNKQPMDPATTTKSADSRGIEVFKQHWSERIETENYDYDFSTASFTECANLNAYKLTVGTQEDCGSSFKQAWRQGAKLQTLESVYFPGTGIHMGEIERQDVVFEDALSLVLRDFPFGSLQAQDFWMLPSQKSTKPVPFRALRRRIQPRGQEILELPIGSLKAERLDLLDAADDSLLASYWFASDGSAPRLHAMLQYEGPGGVGYRLLSQLRTAYWVRK